MTTHIQEVIRLRNQAAKFHLRSTEENYFLLWFTTQCRIMLRTSSDVRRDLIKLISEAERLMLDNTENHRRLRV